MTSSEKCSTKTDEDFDAVLEIVGSRGKYQKKLLYFILVPVSFFLGFVITQLFFQVAVPKHWCHVPGRENTTLSVEDWMQLTIPRENDTEKYSSCLRYIPTGDYGINGTPFFSNQTQGCTDGWEYDDKQFSATVATDNNWYCEKGGYSTDILTLNNAGNAVGTFFLPIVADMIGRRNMFFILLSIHLVFTICYFFVSHLALHLTFRFLRGSMESSLYFMPHILLLEVIHPDDRAKATTISWVAWTFGMCFTSLVAWVFPHWKYLAVISCIPAILGFLYWRHLQESPRWLLAKGRITESAQILMDINTMNGRTTISKDDLEDRLKRLSEQQQENVSLFQIFKYPKLRLRACMLFIMALCLYLVYGIILMGINILPDNQFLSHFILSLSELPSNGLGWALTHYTGRRFTCYLTFSITAALCGVALFCTHNQYLMMAIAALTKIFITTALLAMYCLYGEVFPTPIRSTGTGVAGVFGLVSMAVAPSMLNSGLGATFQYWVMLGVMLVGIISSLTMPETIGLALPQTFQEAEEVGSGRPITTWIHHWNYHKYPGRQEKPSKPDEVSSSKSKVNCYSNELCVEEENSGTKL